MLSTVTFFKCLADQTRLLSTLLLFKEGELCVCELMEALDLSQPKVSRHLAHLKVCGILSDERRGQWVYYRIDPSLPSWAMNILKISAAENVTTLKQKSMRLRDMRDRPSLCERQA